VRIGSEPPAVDGIEGEKPSENARTVALTLFGRRWYRRPFL